MDPAQIATVRTFNRVVTRRVGALSDSFLGRGRPLSEARLLYEIGAAGAAVRDLRSRLSLDSGYLSRLLQSLEQQGLVTTRKAPDDARVTMVALTRKGLREVAALDGLSDAFATSVLTPLSSSQRRRLTEGMAEVERLIQAAAVEITVASPRGAAARYCLDAYFRELATRFAGGFDSARTNPAPPEVLSPPAGYFVVATLDGEPVGCGGLKIVDRTVGEIKRMWVARAVRGLGVGRRILESLEAHARRAHLQMLRLDTNETLEEAHALYRRAGYRETAPFNTEPYAQLWFAKDL
jgi:DNA-binding MarR family transcriptional regulator/RimJ/RimL family protein N-acetyltransferase